MRRTDGRSRKRIRLPAVVFCLFGVVLIPSLAAHGQRGHEQRRGRDEERTRFTRSAEERHFGNGVTLRRSVAVRDEHLSRYFPLHYYSYPHYAAGRASVDVLISPFGFYFGVLPPYIERSHVYIASPPHIFIDVPIYVHDTYVVSGGDSGGYYLDRRHQEDPWRNDPDLRRTVYDLEDAFRNGDITLLAPHADPHTKIAVFAKGHYEYSIEADDYLDMTRDFLRSVQTSGFDAYRVHKKTNGVYQVFARHTYKGESGQTRTVYLCMVVERIADQWTLTQIDTSPERSDVDP